MARPGEIIGYRKNGSPIRLIGGGSGTATFTATFTTAGTFTWVAPSGVTSVSVQCWGGGAGGATGYEESGGVGGGGGGEYAAELTNTCVAGDSYTVVVGAGATAETYANNGGSGASSSFTGTSATTVTAHGGSGGSETGGGGAGGTGSTNSVHHNGGAGGTASGNSYPGGGGGGGSGGTSSAGNTGGNGSNSVGGTGASAVTGGGPGGAGTTNSGAAHAPASGPGGGGGATNASEDNGGAGYAGQVVITWTMSTPATIAANTTGGTYTWTAPASLTSVSSECWGAGGGGGDGTSATNSGGGGGGGEYAAELTNTVVAGDAYTFTVGAAGAGGVNSSHAGGNGGNSTFSGTSATTVTAHGGTGGTDAKTGGTGGSGSSNSAHESGGTGGSAGTGTGGGGGGGSGGTGSAGNTGGNASGSTGGTGATAVTGGGPGGAGGTSEGTGGTPASGPGGGGGGTFVLSGHAGAGWDGQLTLTWSTGPNSTGGLNVKKPALSGTGFKGTITSGSIAVKKPGMAGSANHGNAGSLAVKKPALAGSGSVERLSSGGLAVKKPALHGTEKETFETSGSLAIKKPALEGSGTVQYAIPPGPVKLLVELLINGTWVDITGYVYSRDDIVIGRGKPNEGSQSTTNPQQMTLTVNNRDGRFSSSYPLGAYYPYLTRNSQLRISAPDTMPPPYELGYRFWGEVSEWPPSWDPTGSDVYAQIIVSGIFRRLGQSANLRSALYRYYSSLSPAPLAYWSCEDGSTATQLASGVTGGFPMRWTGTPSLASDTGLPGAAALIGMNNAVFSGDTGVSGALPVANYSVFNTHGSGHWTAPVGVNVALVTAVGAGGGGGSYNASTGGGGGGGGEYASDSIAVTAGDSYAYTVGKGGSAQANGTSTTFTGDSHTVTAHGGSGADGSGDGGAGGTGSTNATHNDGGAGADGSGGSGESGSTTNESFATNSQGSGSWTADDTISGSVTVYCWAGGGGGGGGYSGGGGGGGGGGNFNWGTLDVTGGSSYSYEVGSGGDGGLQGEDGGGGTFTSFTGDDGTIEAHGGNGGDKGEEGAGGSPSSNSGEGSCNFGGDGQTKGEGATSGGGGGGGAGLGGGGSAAQTSSGGSGGGSGGLDEGGGHGGSGGLKGVSGQTQGGNGNTAGGGGGGGAEGTSSVYGGLGGGGQQLYWQDETAPGDAAVGGGGGSSGGSSSAGNDGDTEAGGAAVAGGGPGGGTLSGSTFNAAPVTGPGGGGGGFDSLGSAAAGYDGSLVISYAASGGGGGGGVAANVLRFILHVDAGGDTDGGVVAQMYTTGTIAYIQVIYNTASNGSLTLSGFSGAGATLFTTGEVAFGLDGLYVEVSAELQTDGSNVDYNLTAVEAGGTAVMASGAGTLDGASLGDPWLLVIDPNANMTAAFGQVLITENYYSVLDDAPSLAAYAGETAAARVTRLCTEQGITSAIIDVGDSDTTALMGPQTVDKLVNLLQACEDADRGILFEPRDSFGISYRSRASLYSQAVGVELDYAQGMLAQPLQPTEDDQLTRNDVTVSRLNGSSYEAIQQTGPISIQDPPNGVGQYTYSLTAVVDSDGQLADLASWILWLGTQSELRYPQLALNLMRPEITTVFNGIVSQDLGDYLQVVNPPFWLPPGTIDRLVYGYTETLNAYVWTIATNNVPELPYQVCQAGDPGTGSRADTDGSVLHNGIGTADTTFYVDTAVPNAPWVNSTDNAAEFPFSIVMMPAGASAGEVMTVSEIDGSTTPQQFTVLRGVNGVVLAHSAGEAVNVYQPAVAAL